MNLLLLCLNSLILLCTGPQKCDRSVSLPVKFARRWEGTFKIHYTSQDVSFQKSPKVWFSMTTGILKSLNPRNRNSISVISTKFLFVSSMNTLLESHWRETWRHIDRRTEPTISLETLPPSRVIYNLVQREAWNQISIIFTKCKSEYWPSFRPYIWASLISVVCKGFIYV